MDGVIETVNIVSVCGVAYAVYQIWVVIPKFIDIFKALRVELPLPTKLVLPLARHVSLCLVYVGVYVTLIHLVCLTRSRRLAIAVMVAALASGPLAYESIMLPLFKINEALRKK